MSSDEFSLRYSDLLTGSYDCVDRIVLNAFFPLGYNPGGFRVWWRRWHDDSDAELDNTHLMRLAGRFARRVKAWGAANQVPVMFCKAGQRKHRIAEQYLATHDVGVGVFLVLVAKAPAPVWKVTRSAAGRIVNIERRIEYVNHYSFHIIDPQWGHVTIKMSGHPPFGAQIILNGHEYVARQAQAAGIAFSKAGNCFTAVADPAGLARIADALSQDAAVGRLSQRTAGSTLGATRIGGVDLNTKRMHDALSAVLALAPAPHGFTVGEFAAKVHAITGACDADYSVRQAAYDLRKLRGKQLVDKPARTRRYLVPALAARTIAALLTLRDQVIAPILAAVRSPRMGRKPAHWTRVDRDYERIRIDMHTLFTDLALETPLAA